MIEENKELFNEANFIVGISRGGLIPAALIATQIDKPLVTAYIDKQDNVYLDRTEWLKRKSVVVIDDAVRTGKTMNKIVELVKTAEPKSVKAMAMFSYPDIRFDVVGLNIASEEVMFPWDY